MPSSGRATITREIARTQDKVHKYLFRVEMLEKMLKNKEMSLTERMKLENELAKIKEGIKRSETDLKNFYSQNRKTFIFVVMLMFLTFLVYSVYLLFTNPYS